jgi:phosphatidylinositol glycan class N
LLHEGLEGLRYLQTYDWLFLRTIVTLGYLGWIAYATTTVIDLHVLQGATQPVRSMGSTIFFSSLLVALFAVLWIQNSSWRYYLYGFFPVFFWEEVVAQRRALSAARKVLFAQVKSPNSYVSLAFQASLYIGVIQALVSDETFSSNSGCSFADTARLKVQSYFHRDIYTICFVLAGFWPLFYGAKFLRANKLLVGTWAVACGLMSLFTLLPVVKTEHADTMYVLSSSLSTCLVSY